MGQSLEQLQGQRFQRSHRESPREAEPGGMADSVARRWSACKKIKVDRHDDHVNGNWWLPHANASVQWFDWGDNEPNDFHGQNCMTYMEYRDVIFQNYRDYFWNDSDCKNDVAPYICVKDCADCPEQGTTPAV